MTHLIRALITITLVALAACSSSAGGPVGTPPASATGGPSGPAASSEGSVTTPDEAAQRVIALDPRFAGAGPKNPDLIGGCCFYDATTTADGFQVTVELGWGDCPAGCINRHRWSYAVGRDGATTLLSETGDPVPSDFPSNAKGDY